MFGLQLQKIGIQHNAEQCFFSRNNTYRNTLQKESEPSVLLLIRFLKLHKDDTYCVDSDFILFF